MPEPIVKPAAVVEAIGESGDPLGSTAPLFISQVGPIRSPRLGHDADPPAIGRPDQVLDAEIEVADDTALSPAGRHQCQLRIWLLQICRT